MRSDKGEKNDMFDYLDYADDDMLKEMSELCEAFDTAASKRVFSKIQKKCSSSSEKFETDNADTVRGVDIYRRPKWLRTIAVAASLAVAVFGISGTFYAISRISVPNESATSEYHSFEKTTKTAPPDFDIIRSVSDAIYTEMNYQTYEQKQYRLREGQCH